MYKVGHVKILIPKISVDKMIEWSIPPYAQDEKYDERMVRALLHVCSKGTEDKSQISDDVKNFVKGNRKKNIGFFILV